MFGVMMCRRLRHKRRGKVNDPKARCCRLTLDSLDYLFRLAVEMRTLGLPWTAT